MVPTAWYIVLSGVLFTIGVLGVLIRRNAIVVLMSVELMINAANLSLVAFARERLDLSGQVITLFALVVTAVEVVVGIALLVALFRTRRTVDVDEISTLKG